MRRYTGFSASAAAIVLFAALAAAQAQTTKPANNGASPPASQGTVPPAGASTTPSAAGSMGIGQSTSEAGAAAKPKHHTMHHRAMHHHNGSISKGENGGAQAKPPVGDVQ